MFTIFMEEIDEQWKKNAGVGGTVIEEKKIFTLNYADDIAVVAEEAEGFQ